MNCSEERIETVRGGEVGEAAVPVKRSLEN